MRVSPEKRQNLLLLHWWKYLLNTKQLLSLACWGKIEVSFQCFSSILLKFPSHLNFYKSHLYASIDKAVTREGMRQREFLCPHHFTAKRLRANRKLPVQAASSSVYLLTPHMILHLVDMKKQQQQRLLHLLALRLIIRCKIVPDSVHFIDQYFFFFC